MKAITLYQPYATWIALGIKVIETRRHARFECLVGQTIAIHAARRFPLLYFARAWRRQAGSAIRRAYEQFWEV